MDRLWTPWRYSYITGEKPAGRKGVPAALAGWPGAGVPDDVKDCVFCNLLGAVEWGAGALGVEVAERDGLMVARLEHTFVCLNAFPYASGHVLLVPRRHTDSLAQLPVAEAEELMRTAQEAERVLREVYRPDGVNLGMNLGEAAGAGVAGHVHMHVLPRWNGDTNFMTVTAETRILPEMLETTWGRLRAAWGAGGEATGD